jgi:alpha-ketoglutarate-dependent sulfate ester dioxygenase
MTATEVPSANLKDPAARLAARRYQDPMFADWSGPATYLAPERERLGLLTFDLFAVRRLSPTVGAEISGIDLRDDLPSQIIDELARALAEFKVLFFRDQPISSAQHVAFARRFGDLEIHPFIPGNPELPELVRFEKSAEVAGYENSWHHDVTWRELPSKAAVLHAIKVPDVGGDTLFSDMTAAYDALDDETKELIDGLDAEHDFMRSFAGQVKPGQEEEMRAKFPVQRHPVVVTHPVTGRKCLYVNRNFTTHIVGVEPDESAELLRRLCRMAEYPEHQVRMVWRNDSIAMWDNLAVQHYASSDYWPEIRIMERASVTGPRPSR